MLPKRPSCDQQDSHARKGGRKHSTTLSVQEGSEDTHEAIDGTPDATFFLTGREQLDAGVIT